MNLKIALEWFYKKYSTDKLHKKVLKKVKNIILEWKKVHPKNGI